MTPLALVLLFATPLAWAALDLVRKRLAALGRAVPLTFQMVVAQLPLLLAWTALEGSWTVGRGYWLPALLSLGLNVLANLAYMQSVRLSPMSATLPLLSLTPAFATLLGVPLLGEVPGPWQWLGVAVVVLGALLLNAAPPIDSGGARRASPLAWLRALGREPGSRYMVAVALLWSTAPLLDKMAIRHAAISLHAFFLSAGMAVALLAVLAFQGRLDEIRPAAGTRRLLVAAAIAAVAALALQLWVIQLVWVGLVETVKRGIGAVAALLLGRLVFGEPLEPRRMVAVAVMIAGVWLLLR